MPRRHGDGVGGGGGGRADVSQRAGVGGLVGAGAAPALDRGAGAVVGDQQTGGCVRARLTDTRRPGGVVGKKTDQRSRWVQAIAARRHKNVAVVAVANRMARTAYALLAKGEDYQADHGVQPARAGPDSRASMTR